ncbi:MAG TPA: bifunctional ADP-heptose synthase [Chitinophagales bacterium]|nr:bifunctional ADP-heptose synthase [Chitinophagales bacterium]
MALVSDFLFKARALKILVVGDVMLDKYIWGNVDRISPEAPVPVLALQKQEERLGGAANVAMNLASLGVKTSLASVIGNDAAGKALVKLLRKEKVNTDALVGDNARTTTTKTRVIARHQHVLRIDDESETNLGDALEQIFISVVAQHIDSFKPDAVIFEDYDKGCLTDTVITAITTLATERSIITAVDPKRRNFFNYRGVTLFKPNLREIRDALNAAVAPDQKSLDAINRQLHKKLRHSFTLITLAEHGIYYSNHEQSGCAQAHPRDIADVSGAGDTVIAVATAALAAGFSLSETAELSNLAGGLVCEHAGVVPVTPAMLRSSVVS